MQQIKNLIYNCITFLVNFTGVKRRTQTLLLIKTNEIGDYVLWRNVLPYIRKSKKFRNHHITLLGNSAWRTFFDTFDISFVDDAIWVDKNSFKKNMLYRYRMQKKVRKCGFETVVNVITSRNMREDDAFIRVLNYSFKIGNVSDMTNVLSFEKGYDKNLYNILLNTDEKVFEFLKNIIFTEKLIEEKLPDNLKPSINMDLPLPEQLKDENYFVVFTGSSRPEKIWPTENFIKTTHHLTNKFRLTPVLCGGKDDIKYVENFLRGYKSEVINMCGKTNLLQFANILKHAKLLLSIDTGAVHIAAAVGCMVFGIFNGTRLGRFAPYPKNIFSDFHAVFPDKVEQDIQKGDIYKYQQMSKIPYAAVTAEKVIKKIDEIFKA